MPRASRLVVRRQPPGNDGKCLELQINDKPSPPRTFAPATIVGPTRIKQGFFNVPFDHLTAAPDCCALNCW